MEQLVPRRSSAKVDEQFGSWGRIFAGAFRIRLFIYLGCPSGFGEYSGSFMIIKWWLGNQLICLSGTSCYVKRCDVIVTDRNGNNAFKGVVMWKSAERVLHMKGEGGSASEGGRGVCIWGSTNPPVLTSSSGHCSSWYATYWNAFLLLTAQFKKPSSARMGSAQICLLGRFLKIPEAVNGRTHPPPPPPIPPEAGNDILMWIAL